MSREAYQWLEWIRGGTEPLPLTLHVYFEIPNGTVILQGANRNDTCTGTGHVEVEKEQETFRHRGVRKFQEAGF